VLTTSAIGIKLRSSTRFFSTSIEIFTESGHDLLCSRTCAIIFMYSVEFRPCKSSH